MTTYVESWNTDEQLEELSRLKLTQSISTGVIKSVGNFTLQTRDADTGEIKQESQEVAYFMLPNGITGYCPAREFSDHQYRSLVGFVGQKKDIIVDELILDERIALVSVKKAEKLQADDFWKELEERQKDNTLDKHVYKGVVTGINGETDKVFVRINGVDCFMNLGHWKHGRSRDIRSEIERGQEVFVKVLRFDEKLKLVQVSRRAAQEAPFDKLEQMKDMEAVAGRITEVHPIHGIFVQLDMGLEVKGMKPRYLEEPVVGDVVTCKIRTIDRSRRHCKVVILGYPRGKKARKDVGDFLFQ